MSARSNLGVVWLTGKESFNYATEGAELGECIKLFMKLVVVVCLGLVRANVFVVYMVGTRRNIYIFVFWFLNVAKRSW